MIALEPLHTIALDDLIARAALQTRVDRKYALPLEVAEHVVAELAGSEDVQVLSIGGLRCFGYESLYYDTPELTSYHLSAHGRRRRFKVRRRTYVEAGVSFLEVKTRGMRGLTVKDRAPYEGDLDGDDLLRGADRAFVDAVLDREGITGVRSDELVPTLWTRYQRATLLLPASDTRVTIDVGLEWALPGGEPVALPHLAIVETKSGGAPGPADRRLWAHGHRPRKVSKYGSGLATLRAELPSNKWHSVMSRHFADPSVAAA